MAKNQPFPGRGASPVAKVTTGARVMDAILCIVFLGLALNSGWWLWWASSAFCLLTAVTAPVDKLFKVLTTRVLKVTIVR